MKNLIYLVAAVFLFSACNSKNQTANFDGRNTSAIRPLTNEEKAADFDQLLQLFKTYYGPYKFKEERFNYSIEKTILELKAQSMTAKTDEEFMGYVAQVAATFKDGHVQFVFENSASNISHTWNGDKIVFPRGTEGTSVSIKYSCYTGPT